MGTGSHHIGPETAIVLEHTMDSFFMVIDIVAVKGDMNMLDRLVSHESMLVEQNHWAENTLYGNGQSCVACA